MLSRLGRWLSPPNVTRSHKPPVRRSRRQFSVEPLENRCLLSVNPSPNYVQHLPSDDYKILPGSDVNGTYYFSLTPQFQGNAQLWKSDGTPIGTDRVRDIPAGSAAFSRADHLNNVNGTLFFAAGPAWNDTQLWKSDGTSAGMEMVFDAAGSSNARIQWTINVNGTLYFDVRTGLTSGDQLWKSDGTSAGTVLVKDFAGTQLHGPTEANGKLYFAYNVSTLTSQTRELWSTDGTPDGTQRLAGFVGEGFGLKVYPGRHYQELYVVGLPGTEPDLDWSADVSTQSPWLINVNGTVYFEADDGVHGTELWKTDGTTGGTVMVADMNPGQASSYPWELTNVGGTLYLFSYIAGDYELWKSDGTASGTVYVQSLAHQGREIVDVQGEAYFFESSVTDHASQLWKTDASSGGTTRLKEFTATANDSPSLVNYNGTLYFVAPGGSQGQELWKSDGTSAGTQAVAEITADSGSAAARDLRAVGADLFFTVTDASYGDSLWGITPSLPSLPIRLLNHALFAIPFSPSLGSTVPAPAATVPPPGSLVLGTSTSETNDSVASNSLASASWPAGISVSRSGSNAVISCAPGPTLIEVTAYAAGFSFWVNSGGMQPIDVGNATHVVLDGGGLPNVKLKCSDSLVEQINVQDGRVTYSNGSCSLLIQNVHTTSVTAQKDDKALIYGGDSDATLANATYSSRIAVHGPLVQYGLYDAMHGDVGVDLQGVGSTYVFSKQDQRDQVIINEYGAQDEVIAASGWCIVKSDGYFFEAVNVKSAIVMLKGVGGSTATLLGAPQGNNIFTTDDGSSKLESNGFLIAVTGAKQVNALAGNSTDIAYFYDSDRDDSFVAFPSTAWMTDGVTTRQASGFSHVYAYGGHGHDTAQLLDHIGGGRQDRFAGVANYGIMTDDHTYLNQATGFTSVLATSLNGQGKAEFWGSGANDAFGNLALANFYAMLGSGYLNQAQGFTTVSAFAQGGGADIAMLTGGSLDVSGNAASLAFPGHGGNSGNVSVYGFSQVVAVKKGTDDHIRRLGPIDYVLTLEGAW